MKLLRRKKVPVGGGTGLEPDALNLAKDGDDVRLFVLADGVIYEVSMLKGMSVPTISPGTTDHGLLYGLADDDHSQYTQKATLTAKGDIYVATAASTVTRKAAGTNNYPLVADSAQDDGLRYGGNLIISGTFNCTSFAGTYTVTAISLAIDATHHVIGVTATATMTLPTAVSIAGRIYHIKCLSSGITVTIATTSAQTIDGITSQTLTVQYDSISVVSDGANWIII